MHPPFFARFRLLLWLILPLLASLVRAQGGGSADAAAPTGADGDRTLSPYFQVLPAGGAPGADPAAGERELLPLKSTHVEALIAGVIADVTVTQIYANSGERPLEAIYVFPGSTRAAVHGLTLQVGERRVRAQIQERQQARVTYETARAAGKTSSLLEQQRPNVFQMSVANILPGDTVVVELRYTELLTPVDGAYEFVYPGVVGPRYSNRPAAGATAEERWVANPYLPAGTPDPAAFSLSLRLAAGMPLRDVACRSHSTRITYASADEVEVVLEPGEKSPADRDFILRYRLAGEGIAAGLLLSEAPDAFGENYFLALVQPPARPAPAALPPREYVFVLDVSGSMRGFPLDTAKALLARLLPALRPVDRFNLVLFAGDNRVFAPASLSATPAALGEALAFLNGEAGGGGTELLPALRRALALPRADEHTSRTLAVITDGFVDIDTEAFALVRQNLGRGNVFVFGIGESVNRHLVEGLARAGQGEPFVVTDPGLAAAEAARFAEMIASPVLTRVSARFEGLDAYDAEPAALPDVFARRPVVLFGKWRGPQAGRLEVAGLGGAATPFAATLDVAGASRVPADVLARLWARRRITTLSDDLASGQNPELVTAITALGLKHELLTKFTSFVAVDEVVRRAAPEGEVDTVKQPLPLPRGVGNSAVGGDSIPTSPEPGALGLMGVVAAAGAWLAVRRRRREA